MEKRRAGSGWLNFYEFLKALYTRDFFAGLHFYSAETPHKISTVRRYYSVIYNSIYEKIGENILDGCFASCFAEFFIVRGWKAHDDLFLITILFYRRASFVFSASSSISR